MKCQKVILQPVLISTSSEIDVWSQTLSSHSDAEGILWCQGEIQMQCKAVGISFRWLGTDDVARCTFWREGQRSGFEWRVAHTTHSSRPAWNHMTHLKSLNPFNLDPLQFNFSPHYAFWSDCSKHQRAALTKLCSSCCGMLVIFILMWYKNVKKTKQTCCSMCYFQSSF